MISESSALNGDGGRHRERDKQTSTLTNETETLDTETDDDSDGWSGPGGDGKRVMKAQRMVNKNVHVGPTRTKSTSRKIGNEIRTGRSSVRWSQFVIDERRQVDAEFVVADIYDIQICKERLCFKQAWFVPGCYGHLGMLI
jgi:hypothetical protein